MIKLRLLGSLALERPDGSVVRSVLAQPKRFALLARLAAAHPPASVRRDTLVALLWPELDDEHARMNLRQSLYRLRRSLGPGAVTGKGRELVGVDPERLWCDAAAFRHAVEEDRASDALSVYGGDFLAGFHLAGASRFQRWLEGERRTLRRRAVTAAGELAVRAERQRQPSAAREWAARAVELAPYDEAVFRRYLGMLHRQGDRATAVRAYETFAHRLAEELELEPSAGTADLIEAIRRGGEPAAPGSPGAPDEATDVTDLDPAAPPSAASDPGPDEPASAGEEEGAANRGGPGAARDRSGRSGPEEQRASSPTRGIVASIAAVLVLVAAGYLGFADFGVDSLAGDVRPRIRSLAVLPLENLSADPGHEYFADGMTEALIAELGRLEELTVISRTSAMHYRNTDRLLPEIARQLEVDGVIEGSVLRTGGEVRITLQLVHGRSDRPLWSGSYRGALDEMLDLQRRVARAVAREIEVSLDPADHERLAASSRSPDPEAYEAYLKGRYFTERLGREALLTGLLHLRESVALDSTFALAHAALAEVCSMPALLGEVTALPECRASAEAAVELDGDLAEAHAALGLTRMLAWEWEDSERAFVRALELSPGSVMTHQWYAELLRRTMRHDRALAEIRRAEELDPLNLVVKTMVGWALFSQSRHEEALAQWDEVLEMDPDYGVALYNRGLAYWMMERPDDVLDAARQAARRLGDEAVVVRVLEAAGHALAGGTSRARAMLSRLEASPGRAAPGLMAAAHLTLGEEEEALRWLERGHAARDPWLPNTVSEPLLEGLRDHPRFRRLVRSMGHSRGADVRM